MAIRTALVALPLAALEPRVALFALVVMPPALIELWAAPRVASRGRGFALIAAFASGNVALLAGCALFAQIVYIKAAWEEHSAKAGLDALGRELGNFSRHGLGFGGVIDLLYGLATALSFGLAAGARLLPAGRPSPRLLADLALAWIALTTPWLLWFAGLSLAQHGAVRWYDIGAMTVFYLFGGLPGLTILPLLYWLADAVERRAFKAKP
jgi:hypothetical protein